MTSRELWPPGVDYDTVIDHCRVTALEVAERLRAPQRTIDVVTSPTNIRFRSRGRTRPHWNPLSLADGHAGVALLFSVLGGTCDGYEMACRDHLDAAVGHLTVRSPIGLLDGVASVAFTARLAARGPKGSYRRLLSKLDHLISAHVRHIVSREYAHRRNGIAGTASEIYDVISGLTGVGRYCLAAAQDEAPSGLETLEKTLEFLVSLCEPVGAHGRLVPGWWFPADRCRIPEVNERFPLGSFYLGLSHGVSGPLALLSLCSLNGIEVDGQRDAITHMVTWLEKWRQDGDDGIWWPVQVGWRDQIGQGEGQPQSFRQPSWCHGIAGIARAYQLAGAALGDEALCQIAVDTLLASVVDQPHRLTGAMVCHGVAGLLQSVMRICRDARCGKLLTYALGLADELCGRYDETAPFGYRDTEERPGENGGVQVRHVDKAGLLEGAAGVALVLWTVSRLDQESRYRSSWDAALLLA